MGVVYQAEQSHPRRLVALKMIRAGVLHPKAVRMFQREAEALARLHHSGIADVYESAETPNGQPYFTMELVEGVPLNEYLGGRRERPSTPLELHLRLALFEKICAAVSYAHQKGVIHRDLKPSNILIVPGAAEDAVPEIKVVDFGLARISEEAGGSTWGGGAQGTLSYMSPEQSRGVPEEIDLRTDVYSLGVILYEIVAGRLPYEVSGKELVEAILVIRNETPKLLRTSWTGSKVDADLAAVVLKALEKEPARRYQSVAALGEDIERYLSGQAVLAQPPSTLYQARKLIARHKLAFTFAVTLLVLLSTIAAVMTIQARRIAGERNRANLEAQTSKQVSDFLTGLFEISDPTNARGSTVTARELLDRGAERVDRDLKNQPITQARMQYTLGSVFISLGLYEKASGLLEQAVRTQESQFGPDHKTTTESLDRLASAYQGAGDYAKAEPLFRRVVTATEKNYGPDRTETAMALNNLAVICTLHGNMDEALRLFQRALAIDQKQFAPDNPKIGNDLNNLGALYSVLGRNEEAVENLRKALAIREKGLPADHPDVAETLGDLGVALWRLKRYPEAAAALERSLAIWQKILGPDHDEVGRAMTNLANVYSDEGRLSEAERLYVRALEIREKALGPGHPDVAHSLARLASLRGKQAKYEEAVRMFNRAQAIYDKAVGPNSMEACVTRSNLADLYRDRGQFDMAEPLYRRALAGLRTSSGSNNEHIATVLEAYAKMLTRAGRGNEGDRLTEEARMTRAKQ
jgi:serine/threonine protein kinase/Tfp pilus assembly protein PilF